jgi:hypothetical protein
MADSVNATGLPKILLLLFLLGLSRLVPVTHAQTPVYATYASPAPLTTSNPPSHTPFTDFESAYATSTTTDTYTPWAICATEGAPWMIDPPTATRLVELFCDDLYQPANFPVQGRLYTISSLSILTHPHVLGCFHVCILHVSTTPPSLSGSAHHPIELHHRSVLTSNTPYSYR